MENNTYSNPDLSAYVAEKFYPVKFNAENKSTVIWKGKAFAFNDSYKVNNLALSLTHGQLSFPTTVIITPDNNAPQFISGYLKPAEIEPILKYFGEGAYPKESYKDFKRTFKPSWK
jgi:thioredoxin-related protein